MPGTKLVTSTSASLFEIDAELEAAFETYQEECEATGDASEETKNRCIDLFAEMGKKVDRIAAYVRIQEAMANLAGAEAQRLAARKRTADRRVRSVKQMLMYFMGSRGLKHLKGELNTIGIQQNGQPSLVLDVLALPDAYYRNTAAMPAPVWEEGMRLLPEDLRKQFETGLQSHEPDEQLVRDMLLRGEEVVGARLVKGHHVRIR
jgi:hypothetical protein